MINSSCHIFALKCPLAVCRTRDKGYQHKLGRYLVASHGAYALGDVAKSRQMVTMSGKVQGWVRRVGGPTSQPRMKFVLTLLLCINPTPDRRVWKVMKHTIRVVCQVTNGEFGTSDEGFLESDSRCGLCVHHTRVTPARYHLLFVCRRYAAVVELKDKDSIEFPSGDGPLSYGKVSVLVFQHRHTIVYSGCLHACAAFANIVYLERARGERWDSRTNTYVREALPTFHVHCWNGDTSCRCGMFKCQGLICPEIVVFVLELLKLYIAKCCDPSMVRSLTIEDLVIIIRNLLFAVRRDMGARTSRDGFLPDADGTGKFLIILTPFTIPLRWFVCIYIHISFSYFAADYGGVCAEDSHSAGSESECEDDGAVRSRTAGPAKLARAGLAIVQLEQTFRSVIAGVLPEKSRDVLGALEEMHSGIGELRHASSFKRRKHGEATLTSLFTQPKFFDLLDCVPTPALAPLLDFLGERLFGKGSIPLGELKRLLSRSADPTALDESFSTRSEPNMPELTELVIKQERVVVSLPQSR